MLGRDAGTQRLDAEQITQLLVPPFLAGLGCLAIPPFWWPETGLTDGVLYAVTIGA